MFVAFRFRSNPLDTLKPPRVSRIVSFIETIVTIVSFESRRNLKPTSLWPTANATRFFSTHESGPPAAEAGRISLSISANPISLSRLPHRHFFFTCIAGSFHFSVSRHCGIPSSRQQNTPDKGRNHP